MSDNKTLPDVDKVIRGLEQCADIDSECAKCPYKDLDASVCDVKLYTDAIDLIKAQRRTLDEIDKYVRELDKAVNGGIRNADGKEPIPSQLERDCLQGKV